MRTVVKSALAAAVMAAGLLAAPAKAEAVPFTFSCISPGAAGCAIESQLSVDVLDGGAGLVTFAFSNLLAGADSSIASIFFDEPDDNSLTMTYQFALGLPVPGVVFTQGGNPPVLPDGDAVGFTVDHRFTAAPPPTSYGINPGEFLVLGFLLSGGSTFQDVIASLSQIGGLSIGMHVIGISPAGGSASFVNNSFGGNDPPPVVPEPATMLLLGTGLAGVAAAARRRRRQRAEN